MLEDEYLSGQDLLNKSSSFFREILSIKTLLVVLLFLILANLFYLDLALFSIKSGLSKETVNSLPSPTPVITTLPNSCPRGCLDEIKAATSSTKTTATSTPNNTTTSINNNNYSSVKEFFVPFGSGTSIASDWQDVTGLQATIDSSNYARIKSVIFEATVHIPTGNETAYVRLYNSSDKHPVWFSEVSMEGAGPKFLVSSSLTLDPGQKIYQVQAKTSLQFSAIIDQSRIHIITY